MENRRRLRDIKGFRGAIYRVEQLQARTTFAARAMADLWRMPQLNGSRPEVTAVVVGRNDDYMSDFEHRLRATIAWNAKHLASEVIFVEWNPPAGRELLSFDLAKRFECLRAFVVSRETHESICENRRLPLLEFHAKNVGIRRAHSEWVLTTNADAFFGPDAIRKLLSSPLSDEVIWCAQRIDIPWREGRVSQINPLDFLRYQRIHPYHPLGTGEFSLASKRMWERAGGYDESLVRHRVGVDKRGVAQLIAHGAKAERAGLVLHLAHPTSNVEGLQEHHGAMASWEEDLPYKNDENWGLADRPETEIAERVWLIK